MVDDGDGRRRVEPIGQRRALDRPIPAIGIEDVDVGRVRGIAVQDVDGVEELDGEALSVVPVHRGSILRAYGGDVGA